MVDIDEDVCNFCKEHLEVNRAAFKYVSVQEFDYPLCSHQTASTALYRPEAMHTAITLCNIQW